MIANKYWWLITVMYFCWAMYVTLNGTMLTYYCKFELGNAELMSVITIVEKLPSIITTIAIAPFINASASAIFPLSVRSSRWSVSVSRC